MRWSRTIRRLKLITSEGLGSVFPYLLMADIQELHHFLRGEFDAEARTGFARLRRVPDTQVRHFLDYYESLNAAEQDALADASTLRGAIGLWGERLSAYQETLQTNHAWEKWIHESLTGRGRDPHFNDSVRMLRMSVAQAKMERASGIPSSMSPELEEYAESIQTVTAPQLRKLVREVLESVLGAKPVKTGGGNWNYEGATAGSQVMVSIDYGGRLDQLRYQIAVQPLESAIGFKRTGFEMAFGVGFGRWDFIHLENVSDSMALLGELVTYMAELPHRLPAGCLDGLAA